MPKSYSSAGELELERVAARRRCGRRAACHTVPSLLYSWSVTAMPPLRAEEPVVGESRLRMRHGRQRESLRARRSRHANGHRTSVTPPRARATPAARPPRAAGVSPARSFARRSSGQLSKPGQRVLDRPRRADAMRARPPSRFATLTRPEARGFAFGGHPQRQVLPRRHAVLGEERRRHPGERGIVFAAARGTRRARCPSSSAPGSRVDVVTCRRVVLDRRDDERGEVAHVDELRRVVAVCRARAPRRRGRRAPAST